MPNTEGQGDTSVKEPLRTRSSMLKHRHFIKIHSALAAAAGAERRRPRREPRGSGRLRRVHIAGAPGGIHGRGSTRSSRWAPPAAGQGRQGRGTAAGAGRGAGEAAPCRGQRPGRDRRPGSGAGLARHGRRGCGHWKVESFQGGNKLNCPPAGLFPFLLFPSSSARPSPGPAALGAAGGDRSWELALMNCCQFGNPGYIHTQKVDNHITLHRN